ncbi:MAG: hypothetical protein KF688_04480 [Pirellulales bacterium]|nr:hypothetical protein [Pirellulales bacterium]
MTRCVECKRLGPLLWATPLWLLTACPAVGGEMHTWTDRTGAHKIDAEFVEVVDGNVTLKKATGETVTLPLSKLSKPDQTYLRALVKRQREAQAAPPAAAPTVRGRGPRGSGPTFAVGDRIEYRDGFTPRAGTVTGYDGSHVKFRFDGDPEDAIQSKPESWVKPLSPATAERAAFDWTPPGVKPPLTPDDSAVRRVASAASAPTGCDPDPASTAAAKVQPALGIADPFGHYEKVLTAEVVAEPRPLLMVARTGGNEFNSPNSRIEIYDLSTGVRTANFSGPPNLTAAALSPSGQRVATRTKPDDSGLGDRLDVWDVGEKSLVHAASWRPYQSSAERKRAIASARWIDDERIATTGGEGTWVLWDAASAKAVWQVAAAGGWTSSPGRRQVAIAGTNGVDVFAVDTGDQLAHFAGVRSLSRPAFSPSGKRLAIVGAETLVVVDVAGKLPPTVFSLGRMAGAAWVDERLLLTDDGLLLDADRGCAIWRYRATGATWVRDGALWYLAGSGSEGQSLQRVALPHPAAASALAAIATSDVFALKPGDKISLDVDLGDQAVLDEARRRLTQAAAAAGLEVADGQAAVLTARTRSGESQTREFRAMFGLDRQTASVTANARHYEVALTVGGETLWSWSTVQTMPYSVRPEANESIQDAVYRAMNVSAMYLPDEAPRNLVKAEFRRPRGESQLTAEGVVDGGNSEP